MHHTLAYPRHPGKSFSAIAAHWPGAVWLDSGGVAGTRYDIIAAAPRAWFRVVDGVVRRRCAEGGTWVDTGLFPDGLRAGLDRAPAGPPPFAGGLIGYFGYDLGRRLMGLADASAGTVEAEFGRYDWAVVIDHHRCRAWLAGPAANASLAHALDAAMAATTAPARPWRLGPVLADLDRGAYAAAFARVQHYLHAGDCYQVNLARRFEAPLEGDPLGLWLALREASPGGYGAYLDLPGRSVLSISPERFLQLRDGAVETRPIKGTRPRDPEPRRDAALAADLRGSPKDRAENLMIVDLLRNDLGRVCETGSVRVPRLFDVERLATVQHLVSVVTGRLPAGRDALDLVAACLPGGSITGAPKHRAMQIIDELEPTRRGVYCGAVGYLGDDGAMDTSIAIRTAVAAGGRVEYRAGGGVVADSTEAGEFDETGAKAAAFLGLVSAPR
ncbi:aminodeoxychorismate synthase component I [Arhodomonas aquaeolei]|uniref:aminodeoxychorismate synthase component I n=1 Tax=Arhodomonas aquaeolei TaxID=2369 RepID=UPI0021695504|nr:aminodeoxychorismate synthase component I [Arhodomonas aquaeolei]MCS4504181.1 aminodeoxychorismate synthase component I [Arhodomonas aquaeolei]